MKVVSEIQWSRFLSKKDQESELAIHDTTSKTWDSTLDAELEDLKCLEDAFDEVL